MREILFRGKRLDNGEWVEGFYYFSKWYLNGEFTGEITYYILPIGTQDSFEVDPATVGQYTGATDKNDKKIFEGDIAAEYGINGTLLGLGPVALDDTFFAWHVGGATMYRPPLSSYKVIGNIHDPEIVEEVQ